MQGIVEMSIYLFIYLFFYTVNYTMTCSFSLPKKNKKKRTHCKIILNAITVIHCIYGKLLLTTFLQSFKIYVSFQCGTVAINRHLHFSIQQTKLEEPSCFTSASPTAGASSASELAGVISVGFWPFGLKSHWTSVVANKIAGQARPHEDCSKAKQLRLELLDKRAWVGTQGMIVPWETCDRCVEEKKKKKILAKSFQTCNSCHRDAARQKSHWITKVL